MTQPARAYRALPRASISRQICTRIGAVRAHGCWGGVSGELSPVTEGVRWVPSSGAESDRRAAGSARAG
ncbi:MAG: hypothetical protein QOG01_983 [Pseudonocardiales bacterium]|jgi:hypothetical protein|nr:hypothetical protein [Pseudonocardiales bacterium]